jgi:hypothetical protein
VEDDRSTISLTGKTSSSAYSVCRDCTKNRLQSPLEKRDERILGRTQELDRLSEDAVQPARPQEQMHRHPRNVRAVPKSRDFH